MPASARRSASASAAMETNSLPRWLISITDMPASCQLTSSRLAFSSTSTGMVAGPAPKLKMRCALLLWGAAAIDVSVAGAVGKVLGLRIRLDVAMAIAIAVALGALLVAVQHALQAGELLALAQVDQGDTLRRTAHLADLVDAR